MNVQGRDCTLAVITTNREMDIPYSEETIREAVTLLEENPCIEGDGAYRAIRKNGGSVGCVVTPLALATAPLLLYLAMGDTRYSDLVSGTGDIYKHILDLLPTEETGPFGLVQYRGDERKYYPALRVTGFELRILRDENVKLKLDVSSEKSPALYPYQDAIPPEGGERFRGENVTYKINGTEYGGIYGLTLSVKKEGGTKTEVWLRRVLEQGADLPETIDELTVTARLLKDSYGERHFGAFRLTLRRLLLQSDETSIECPDSVIGPLRYFAND